MGDVSSKTLRRVLDLRVNLLAFTEQIFVKWIVKIVGVSDGQLGFTQNAFYEARTLIDLEQPSQRTRRLNQARALLEPGKVAATRQRGGNAKLSRARTDIDHRSNVELAEPFRSTHRNP